LELEARIGNYELAARMQLATGDVLDLSRESEATKRLYGLDNENTSGYRTRCLMDRRLVEAGVRFVQVFLPVKPPFRPLDSHGNSKSEIEAIAHAAIGRAISEAEFAAVCPMNAPCSAM
jgi:hypothetical protein